MGTDSIYCYEGVGIPFGGYVNDLLLWQRFNKAWLAAIQTSPRIRAQEKLYFRAKICKDENDLEGTVLDPFTYHFFGQSDNAWVCVPEDAFGGKASYPTAGKARWVREMEERVCDTRECWEAMQLVVELSPIATLSIRERCSGQRILAPQDRANMDNGNDSLN